MKRQSTLRSVVVLGFVLAVAGTAWGNGGEFFAPPASTKGPVDLVYAGQIRDKGTGRLIPAATYVMVTDLRSGLNFGFATDSPGHFRSPDIGKAIKGLGGTVDAKSLSIKVTAPGYKIATIATLPREITGVVEVNFTLEPESK